MAIPKVIFLGNCQAQAFESLVGHLRLDVDVISAPPIWQVTDEDEEELTKSIDAADFVFSQRMSPTYPVNFIRNATLRDKFGGKVITWPNLYFDGYFPGIRYLYNSEGKIVGPLGDYHFQWILDGWRAGASVDDTVLKVNDIKLWAGNYDFVEMSLYELSSRERDVDVKICDYVKSNFRRIKLFYSMNHPKTPLLGEMLKRIFNYAGISFQSDGIETYGYALDEIIIPTFPIFDQKYRPNFHDEKLLKGINIYNERNPPDKVKHYSFNSIVECYYSIYDNTDI